MSRLLCWLFGHEPEEWLVEPDDPRDAVGREMPDLEFRCRRCGQEQERWNSDE